MRRDIGIVHYNTPELTAALVRSIRKFTSGCHITVLDNSDKRPFEPSDGVSVLDNTRGQLVDFKALLGRYPDQQPTCNDQGSAKHIASVDYLFDILTDGFVLMDSDILLKRDIGIFWDESVAWMGSAEPPRYSFMTPRLAPYLLWLNVPMLRAHGIRFWHEGMAYKLSHSGEPYYDTGGSLYRDCTEARLPEHYINIYDYIEHYGSGSYNNSDPNAVRYWLDKHKSLHL